MIDILRAAQSPADLPAKKRIGARGIEFGVGWSVECVRQIDGSRAERCGGKLGGGGVIGWCLGDEALGGFSLMGMDGR